MTEILRGMDTRTAQPVEFRDTEPLESARLFRSLSDAILDQRPDSEKKIHEVPSVLALGEAVSMLDTVLRDIDERFVVTAKRGGRYALKDRSMPIGRRLGRLTAVSLESETMDHQKDSRHVEIDDESYHIMFADGHRDYFRELVLKLKFTEKQESTTLRYRIIRHQAKQNLTTRLFSTLWNDAWEGTDQDERGVYYSRITEPQERSFLQTCRVIGGLSLPER